jgi:hypothetical protein
VRLRAAALQHFFINIPKREETLALVLLVFISPTPQVTCEEFHFLGNVVLLHHVLDGRLDGLGLHRVNLAEREAEQAVAFTLCELRREFRGEFDGLVLDAEAAEGYVVGADGARGVAAVAVADAPCVRGELLVGAGLAWVEDAVFGGDAGFLRGWVEFGRPELGC